MTALQLQLLIAVAHTVRDMASNPLAPVSTARLSEALAAVEERYGEPRLVERSRNIAMLFRPSSLAPAVTERNPNNV